MPKIKELELETIRLKDQLKEIDNELEVIEKTEMILILNLAENLTRKRGNTKHDLGNQEKRDLELYKRLHNDNVWLELVDKQHEIQKDICFARIERDFEQREHERSMRK